MTERDRADPEAAPRAATRDAWWGDHPFSTGTWGHWRVGPLSLWVGRTEHDWQIAYVRDDDPFHDACRVELPVDLRRVPIPPDAERHRVAFARAPDTLTLRPMLADRAVVARPDATISIPPREKISVFVSSAVWIGLGYGPDGGRLLEIPTWRSSDTWFGDNQNGFLCYATRTAMRLELVDLPIRPQRAVTPIVIDNRGADALQIERISLPIPNLSVFRSESGALWTEELHLTRTEHAELARVHVERDRPPVPGAVRIGEPRQAVEDGLLSRVFTGLFG